MKKKMFTFELFQQNNKKYNSSNCRDQITYFFSKKNIEKRLMFSELIFL